MAKHVCVKRGWAAKGYKSCLKLCGYSSSGRRSPWDDLGAREAVQQRRGRRRRGLGFQGEGPLSYSELF